MFIRPYFDAAYFPPDYFPPFSVIASDIGETEETDSARPVLLARIVGIQPALEIDVSNPVFWAPKPQLVRHVLEIDAAHKITQIGGQSEEVLSIAFDLEKRSTSFSLDKRFVSFLIAKRFISIKMD